MPTVLYAENNYPDDSVERRIYGPDVKIIIPNATTSLADLTDEQCAQADGLMTLRYKVTGNYSSQVRRSPGVGGVTTV